MEMSTPPPQTALTNAFPLIPLPFPGPTTLLLALLSAFLLLALLRAAHAFLIALYARSSSLEQRSTPEKAGTGFSAALRSYCKWEGLPVSLALPVSLEMGDPAAAGVGVGVGVAAMKMQMEWQVRRQPSFAHPPPSLYESNEPLSAAKIIMSRHTYRRPNPTRPPRHASAHGQKRPSRLLQSMV